MAVETQTTLTHETIKDKIGAYVLNSKEELLSGTLGDALRDLLEERGVLVFPKIGFTNEEQIAFTKTLGTYAPERKGDEEEVTKISIDPAIAGPTAEYLKGSLYWHIDGTMQEVPILASILSCKKPSPKGTGNTGFSNTYAAYDALPQEEKDRIEDLKVRHGAWATLFFYNPEPPVAMLKGMQAIGDNTLPLVWTHKSGRKSLVIGNTAHTVVDMDVMEGRLLLNELREWATREEFTYSHEWSEGDLVIWDNTGTMHRAEWYDVTSGRLMVRTKLEGEEPFA
ncbi:TauD/TfdA dioxygenase family protein [Novosphingobium mangrovi (ex Hu et al. 2023)]|uniref:TauD/TfdA family dioxygenase n=1 Tax=Novosphingobium mangrovi (ex Hu et al. 2023) TaxID=2930094 RepID=A0ABT0AGL4_9SPHN|nr:TauD/TfdA family dioxygenase [Novosphingobium mangrovi (ex Hu et al. 2023)]MCJ1962334.1 TauD/TfdA family dioxygenase [Novosphingobium mangrovi (ex Hu et al. 2023)]